MEMKRVLAGGLTAVLMGLLLWSGLRRGADRPGVEAGTAGATDPAGGPEARLLELLDSARRGDVESYLAAFDGPVRSRLGREVEERGRETFAADLRRSAEARKSHAVFAPEPDGPDAVRITVETVYADRNERQTYRLTREGEGADSWLVAGVETVRGHTPKARFGTPAQYQEPEGVPVQGLAPPPPPEEDASLTRSDVFVGPGPIPEAQTLNPTPNP